MKYSTRLRERIKIVSQQDWVWNKCGSDNLDCAGSVPPSLTGPVAFSWQHVINLVKDDLVKGSSSRLFELYDLNLMEHDL